MYFQSEIQSLQTYSSPRLACFPPISLKSHYRKIRIHMECQSYCLIKQRLAREFSQQHPKAAFLWLEGHYCLQPSTINFDQIIYRIQGYLFPVYCLDCQSLCFVGLRQQHQQSTHRSKNYFYCSLKLEYKSHFPQYSQNWTQGLFGIKTALKEYRFVSLQQQTRPSTHQSQERLSTWHFSLFIIIIPQQNPRFNRENDYNALAIQQQQQYKKQNISECQERFIRMMS